jgi:hypothetical protein
MGDGRDAVDRAKSGHHATDPIAEVAPTAALDKTTKAFGLAVSVALLGCVDRAIPNI